MIEENDRERLWVGEALASPLRATEVAPTPRLRDYRKHFVDIDRIFSFD